MFDWIPNALLAMQDELFKTEFGIRWLSLIKVVSRGVFMKTTD